MNENSKGTLLFASRLTFSIIFLGFLGLYVGLLIHEILGVVFMILGVLFAFFGNIYLIFRELKKEEADE